VVQRSEGPFGPQLSSAGGGVLCKDIGGIKDMGKHSQFQVSRTYFVHTYNDIIQDHYRYKQLPRWFEIE
jgi:hypothetical protein